MITIEKEEYGYYSLGFFHIYIKTNENLNNLNKLIESNSSIFSTFLHEYIHFLQNLTTISSLYSSNFYIDLIKNGIHQVNNSCHQNVNIPLNLDNKYNSLSKTKLNTIYLGKSNFYRNKVVYQSYSYQEVEITDIQNIQNIRPKKYIIEFINSENYSNETYHFGLIAIKEYVANQIQNKFTNAPHPDIPYLICDLIINKEIPALKNETNLKILICDASLMSYHPAQTFFEIIENLKKQTDFPITPGAFFNYILKDIGFIGEEGRFNNYIELYNFTYQNAIKNYTNVLKSKVFKNELSWILYVMEKARKIRTKNPTFMIELVTNQKLTRKFKKIVKKTGTPFFINSNHDGGFVPPRHLSNTPNQNYILLAASEMLNSLYGKTSCDMFDFCKKNHVGNNPTNSNCINNPFLKKNEKEACPFIQLSKTWGITKKDLIK